LPKADGARDLGSHELVPRKSIAVQQHDGDTVETRSARSLEVACELRGVERFDHSAVGADALDGADDARVQHLREPDVEREDVGPLLAADPNRVLEPGRDHEHGRLAAALKKRVRRDGGAHLDGRDAALALRCRGQQPLDAGDGGVVVTAGIDGQELQRLELAGRRASDDVRERAPAVDPEFPPAVDHVAIGLPAVVRLMRRDYRTRAFDVIRKELRASSRLRCRPCGGDHSLSRPCDVQSPCAMPASHLGRALQ
jgi:hypothetical protein